MRKRNTIIVAIAFSLVALIAVLVLRGRGADPGRILDRADEYFANEDFDSARIEYINLIKQEPENAHAYAQIGYGFLEQGLPLRAIPYIGESLKIAPENIKAKGKLASAIFSLGDIQGSRKVALEILDKDALNEEAILLLANASRQKPDLDEVGKRLLHFDEQKQAVFHLVSAIVASRREGADLKTTKKFLDRALELEPESVAVQLARATYFKATKDNENFGNALASASANAPIRSGARVGYAGFLARSGEAESAKQRLEELTEQAKDFVPAWIMLAELAAGEKLYEEALGHLEKVFARDPLNYAAKMTNLQILLAQNEIDEAIKLLEQLDGAYKAGDTLHRQHKYRIKLTLARLHARGGELGKAKNVLDQALDIYRLDSPENLEEIARAEAEATLTRARAEATLALAEINVRTGAAREASDSLVALLTAAPGMLQAELLLAQAYSAQQRLDAAEKIYRGQIERDPATPGPHFLLGLNLISQQRPDDAYEELEAAQKLAPDDQGIDFQLIGLDIGKEDFAAAHARAQALLDKEGGKEDWSAHFLQGKVFVAEKKWDEAEQVLLKALELKPDSLSIYNLLIDSYIAAGNQDGAIRRLRDLLESKPKSMQHRMLLALLLQQKEDYKTAAEEYAQLLVDAPDFVPALNNLAYLKSLDDIEGAYRLANKAHTLAPEDAGIADTLGWILYQKGDYSEASDLLKRAADQIPGEAEIQFHLGMVHAKMGKGELARIALGKALASEGDFRGKVVAAKELAQLGGAVGDQTMAELEARLAKDPEDLIARIQLAGLFEQESAFDKAAASLELALETNPDMLEALIGLARLHAGPLYDANDAPAAAGFVSRALALSPGNSEAEGIKGIIALRGGDFEYAYGLLRTSLADPKNSDRPAFQFAMARAAYGYGRLDEARQWMGKVAAPAGSASPEAKAAAGSSLALTEAEPGDLQALQTLARERLGEDAEDLAASMLLAATLSATGGEAAKAYEKILDRVEKFVPAQKALAVIYARDPNHREDALALTQKVARALPDDPVNTRTRGILSYHKDEKNATFTIQLLKPLDDSKALDAEGLFYLGMAYMRDDQPEAGAEALQRSVDSGLSETLSPQAKEALDGVK